MIKEQPQVTQKVENDTHVDHVLYKKWINAARSIHIVVIEVFYCCGTGFAFVR